MARSTSRRVRDIQAPGAVNASCLQRFVRSASACGWETPAWSDNNRSSLFLSGLFLCKSICPSVMTATDMMARAWLYVEIKTETETQQFPDAICVFLWRPFTPLWSSSFFVWRSLFACIAIPVIINCRAIDLIVISCRLTEVPWISSVREAL